MKNPLPIGEGMYDRKIVDFIDFHWKTRYRPPTIREIRNACGVSSTSTVAYTLLRLVKSGKYVLSGGIVPVWVKKAIEGSKCS